MAELSKSRSKSNLYLCSGVDPLLRVTIWKRLENLCIQKGVTVIMTTHYIEEARAAETVGFLRNGQLLVQSKPDALLRQYNSPTLEDCFLKLAEAQNQNIQTAKSSEHKSTETTFKNVKLHHKNSINKNYHPTATITPTHIPSVIVGKRPSLFDFTRFRALLSKNLLTMQRKKAMTLFCFVLPTLEFILFMLVATKSPQNIPISIVNDESPAQLTAMLMENLNGDTLVRQQEMSMEKALINVKNGKSWAALHLNANYTRAVNRRRKDVR